MYVAFEGHDGSGKTTTAEMVYNNLIEQGKDAMFIRAPGFTKFGQYIRQTWHDNLRVRYLQFLAHHVELLEDVIHPAIAQGKWVVQDRTYISSIVYSANVVKKPVLLTNFVDWITPPDKLFVLECPVQLAAERLRHLDKDLPDPDESELHNLQVRYRIECSALGGHLIDTSKPQDEVVSECLNLLYS